MESVPPTAPSGNTNDDCLICLSTLAPGTPLLTLSCNHKFHLLCLASNVKAQNNECPLCRAALDASLIQLLAGANGGVPQQQQQAVNPPVASAVPSVEDLIDESATRAISARVASARQAAVSSLPLITALTTLEFDGQMSHQESNIYGLVTLKAPHISWSLDDELSSSSSRVPIDLVCVVDQSHSMSGEKMALLKQTLIYIVEQMSELDRLAIISFNTQSFDRSHGLKCMNQQNQEILKRAIIDDIKAGGGTYIGCGLEMGTELFTSRQTKNPLGALLLLTDGQDNQTHDYSQVMQRLPEGVLCHTFGYGPDHTTALLVQLAEQGNGGTFTYIDEQQAVGPAFAMSLAGLLTCVAQQIRVRIEFDSEYKITHAHSKYKHEPEQLPSSMITFKLNDLNAEEQRNLVFQLHVPKIEDEQSVEMASQEPMSQNQTQEDQQPAENHVIGRVSIEYVEPTSGRTLTTLPVSFQLIRASHLSPDHLKVNYKLDIQRNRVETALVLKRAMDEDNYSQSLDLLKEQVKKIKTSVSVQDSFCQQLIKDLEYSFPSEQEYRSSRSNACRQHQTERGTYTTTATTSAHLYLSPQQKFQAAYFMNKYT